MEQILVYITQLESYISTLPPTTIKSILVVVSTLALRFLFDYYFTTPKNEIPSTFTWVEPKESIPGWSSKSIKSPSIHSHLKDSTLLPPSSAISSNSDSKSYITCYAPATGNHLITLTSLTKEEIKEKITKAQIAQLKWKETSFSERRRLLSSILNWVVLNQKGIARTASRDTGKTMVDAAFGEILTTCEKLRWTIAYGEKHLKPESRPTNMILAHKVSKVYFESLGVVAAIVSWNYPFHNLISPIISSLFTGNAIILKPSENVAWSSQIFIQAIRDILSLEGFDPDLVQSCICLPSTVEALTSDTRLGHITFIGSEEVGKLVAIKAAEVGTTVLLELGGKDPCIILPSADLKYFYDTWMRAAFQAAGQNCIGVERFIVAGEVYDEFVEVMQNRVGKLVLGDILGEVEARNLTELERTDVGAMVTDRLFDRLEELIEEAVSQGARLLVGGKRYIHPKYPNGHYFTPTLLVDVLPFMKISQQEVFAPVMTVMKFDLLSEAIILANGTKYGLGASVFGRSKEDCRYVVKRLNVGMVCTNDFGVFYLNQSLPFGGCKSSGSGRFAGPEGLKGLCNLKAVTEDRFHGSLQTGIPPLLAYPIRNGKFAWKFVSGLVEMMYGDGLLEKAKGLWNLATAGH